MRYTLALLPLLLAACAKDPAPASAPPDTTAAAPSSADTATAPAAADLWTATPTALGPLRIGMTPAEAAAALDTTVAPDYMEGSTCGYASFQQAGRTVFLMFSEGTLARFDTASERPSFQTTDGFGIGSTEAQITARYPDVRKERHQYVLGGHYLIVLAPADTAHRYVFETDTTGVVTGVRAGRLPEVSYVEGCS